MALQFVKKWGNSPAVRLPAAIMEAAHLSLDQPVEVRAENRHIVNRPAAPTYSLDDLLARHYGQEPAYRAGLWVATG